MHRIGAFGGKSTLWDHMCDVGKIISCSKQVCREGSISKACSQAMKIDDGRRMCDLFSVKFLGPSYKTIKEAKKKGV